MINKNFRIGEFYMGGIDFYKIKEAVERRNIFLVENPEVQPLQNEIDELLKSAGKDHYKRQVVLQEKMLNTLFQIVEVYGSP